MGQSWSQAEAADVYFGTGGGEAKGIYHAQFDARKGTLSDVRLAVEVERPGFLAMHPDQSVIYAVAGERDAPFVAAYQIGERGILELRKQQPLLDGSAAHIGVHPSGRFLLTAQYGGGSVAVYPLAIDGALQACSQVVEHEGRGSGVVERRQGAPHPHWVGFSPDGRFAFVPDLGLDQIVIYRVNVEATAIERVGAVDSIPGGGPRHMRFSADGRFVYLLNELTLSVTTFAYDADTGRLERLTTTPTLSEAAKARESFNSSAEILVHPNGRFVYASNRGSDTVTAFEANPETGELQVVDVEPIRGAWPRNINMDTHGRWLLAAGAHSNTVAVMEIDSELGVLTYPRKRVYSVPNVVCILIND